MKKTYHGSCHCGTVQFETDIDLSQGTGKCNCSICTKTRAWGVMLKPEAVRVLAGEADLTDYQSGPGGAHHPFCRHCGVRLFSRGHAEVLGGEFYFVRLTSLDDAEPEELVSAPIRYFDGLNDNWMSTPAEARHL